jgi:hypothetical protein
MAAARDWRANRHESRIDVTEDMFMKTALKWITAAATLVVAGYYAAVGVQAGRRRIKNTLHDAEAVAASARKTLEQTEQTVRTAREAI